MEPNPLFLLLSRTLTLTLTLTLEHGSRTTIRQDARPGRAATDASIVQHGQSLLSSSRHADADSASFPTELVCTPGQVFEFVFSQPFVKGSRTWNDSPRQLRNHVLAPIPPDRPSFRDGKTGQSFRS